MLTPKEALDIFNAKLGATLPKGVTAKIIKSGNVESVVVGTKDLFFSLQGESFVHGEDYLLLRAKQSLTSLKEVLEPQVVSHKPHK